MNDRHRTDSHEDVAHPGSVEVAEHRRDHAEAVEDHERRSPPAWKAAFEKRGGPKGVQFGLAFLLIATTVFAVVLRVLLGGGTWLITCVVSWLVVCVAVAAMNCRSWVSGQVLGAACGVIFIGIATVIGAIPPGMIGLALIFYAPTCVCVGGLWAMARGMRET